MEHGSCTVSGDVWLPGQLEGHAFEMEGLVGRRTEGELVARPFWPWLHERWFRIPHAHEGPRDELFLCASGFVMLLPGGGEKSLILVIVTVPAA